LEDYDAVSLAPTGNAPLEWHQTVFPVSLAAVFRAATELAAVLRSRKAFTNTSTFDLRCEASDLFSKGLRRDN
jgi:ubiquitin thioesterase OTU1